VDPLSVAWSADQAHVMQRLGAWAEAYGELDHHLATWMSLPVPDAKALSQVVWAARTDRPLSPGELARRIGMTSGATTILLNRLEAGGHVLRSREHADRRRVTLRATATADERVREFVALAGTEVAGLLEASGDDELRVVAAFVGRLLEATTAANGRLAERPRR
jgi:MarR family transcriptional regulator, organic hydroperoxide resistance regulator